MKCAACVTGSNTIRNSAGICSDICAFSPGGSSIASIVIFSSKSSNPLLLDGREDRFELAFAARIQHRQMAIEHACRILHLPEFRIRGQALWIDQKGDRGCVRNNLHQSLEPRRFQLLVQDAHAGHVRARPGEAGDETHGDRSRPSRPGPRRCRTRR